MEKDKAISKFSGKDVIQFEDMYDTNLIDKQLEIQANEEDDPNYMEFDEKDYEDFYAEEVKMANIEIKAFNLDIPTTFDGIIKKYQPLIGLKGSSYNAATKLMFYSLLANQLKFNKFSMESKQLDLRLNILLQLKAGHGKKNYEYFIKRTIESLGKEYQEPTSYHPEQFVGKIVVKERKNDDNEYEFVPGTLASDFLVIDEAHAILTRKDNEECLRYIRTALDPINENTITKKQVNVPDAHKLKYDPTCTMLLLTQPISRINEDLLMRGSFRRFVVLFVDTTGNERRSARRASQFLTLRANVHDKMWLKWIEFNKKLSEYTNLQYICHDASAIDDYLDQSEIDAREYGKEVMEYFNTAQFTIKQNIFKMSIIRAIIEYKGDKNTITITEDNIKSAIDDWHAIWMPQVHWIAQQMSIDSLTPLRWLEDKHGALMNLINKMPGKRCKTSALIEEFIRDMPGKTTTNTNKTYKLLKEMVAWGMIRKIPVAGSKRFEIESTLK